MPIDWGSEDGGGRGKGLSKHYGPLPVWGWALAGVGTYLVYRYWKARQAASAALASLGTTGGQLLPGQITGTTQGASPASGAGTFSSVASWEQALLTFLTGNGMSASDAFSAVNGWLGGNCVSQAAYGAISAALVSSSVGLPPGYSTIPTLSVCPAPQQTPTTSSPSPTQAPANSAAPVFPGIGGLHITMNPGESVVASAWDSALNEFIVLTNQGGIYDVAPNGGPGSVFYGSYLGLPSGMRQGTRNFTSLNVNPDGTYTAIANTGEAYTFNPQTAALEGV